MAIALLGRACLGESPVKENIPAQHSRCKQHTRAALLQHKKFIGLQLNLLMSAGLHCLGACKVSQGPHAGQLTCTHAENEHAHFCQAHGPSVAGI